MTRRRLAVLALASLAGCSEVLGLGDYTNAGGEGGADGLAAVDAGCGLGLACVGAAPTGWTGPVALWRETGAPPPPAPDCGGAFAQKLYDGHGALAAPPATCGCACGAPTGATCGAVTVGRYSVYNCTGQCSSPPSVNVTPGGCANVTPCGGGFSMGSSTPSGGSCAPSPSKDVAPGQWAEAARVCALGAPPAQGSCASGEACVPVPAFPYAARACVLRAGDVACPPGRYADKHVYFDGFVDARDCSACTCGAPAGVDCDAPAHVVTYDQTNCTGNTLNDFTPLPRSCSVPGGATKSLKLTTAPSGGACAPGAVAPTGEATPQNPTTVCCEP